MSTIRLWLDTLAQSVNSRRASGAQIGPADLDRMSNWLVEEINADRDRGIPPGLHRSDGDRDSRTAGDCRASTNWNMNASILDKYVFEFSRVFLPSDRTD